MQWCSIYNFRSTARVFCEIRSDVSIGIMSHNIDRNRVSSYATVSHRIICRLVPYCTLYRTVCYRIKHCIVPYFTVSYRTIPYYTPSHTVFYFGASRYPFTSHHTLGV